jgi:acyl-CoA reductase-like NAD-dependent aldehyde dehydrogenase
MPRMSRARNNHAKACAASAGSATMIRVDGGLNRSAVASQIEAGRVVINGAPHDPAAPFGGFKQSGIGREYGVFGLQAYLEPKAILGGIAA